MAIANSAIIEEKVQLGKNVSIWNNSIIRSGAVVGSNTLIGSNVYIDRHVQIGERCKIQNSSIIYQEVLIKDDVFVGPRVTFTNVLNPRSFVERKHEFLETVVLSGCTIGASSTIVCGNTIGSFSFIGASSLVTKNIGSHQLWYGIPATFRGYISRWGDLISINEDYREYVYECLHTGDSYYFSDARLKRVNYGVPTSELCSLQ